VLIKAAINGGRTRAEHAAVPVSPEEQAADVVACLKAGAGAVHLHVRVTAGSMDAHSAVNENGRQDEHPTGAAPMGTPLVCAPSADVVASSEGAASAERESLYPEDVARTILAVRAAAPKAAVGVSTGAWILPHPARLQAAAAWEVLPDFASVNFSEDGAAELARLLLARGVDVEAGLSYAADAEVFLASGLAASCIRVLIEPQEQEMARAAETVNAIEKVLETRTQEARLPPLLLHGTEATAWPMLDEAIARGHDVRIGLEDTLVMPDGRMAKDNAELVTEAVRRHKLK
jgi:uncharacterized protein (DUF849 family)